MMKPKRCDESPWRSSSACSASHVSLPKKGSCLYRVRISVYGGDKLWHARVDRPPVAMATSSMQDSTHTRGRISMMM